MRRRFGRALLLLLVGSGLLTVVPGGGMPPATAQTPLPHVLLIGDSVLHGVCGIRPFLLTDLAERFATACLTRDRAPFRTTADVPGLVEEHLHPDAGHLVVAVGYNDGFSASRFRSRLDAVMTHPRVQELDHVLWLDLRDVNGVYGGANAALRAAEERYDNLEVLPWHATSLTQRREMTGPDGVHLTGAGATVMAGMITDALIATLDAGVPDPIDPPDPTDPTAVCGPPAADVVRTPDPAAGAGYWLLDAAGVVHVFGGAAHHGDLTTAGVERTAVSMQRTASGGGYWILTDDGAVHAFGDAADHGDLIDLGIVPDGPVRRLEPHPAGAGYWLMGDDGGVFTLPVGGDGIGFWGSVRGVLPPGRLPDAPIISLTSAAAGNGYYLVGADGGVFTFGPGATFRGSTGGTSLDAPVIALAVGPDDGGYWLYASDGGVFTYGDLGFYGSVPGLGLCTLPTTVTMRPTLTGAGYWIATDRGWVIPFGDAVDHGSIVDGPDDLRIVDMAVAPT